MSNELTFTAILTFAHWCQVSGVAELTLCPADDDEARVRESFGGTSEGGELVVVVPERLTPWETFQRFLAPLREDDTIRITVSQLPDYDHPVVSALEVLTTAPSLPPLLPPETWL